MSNILVNLLAGIISGFGFAYLNTVLTPNKNKIKGIPFIIYILVICLGLNFITYFTQDVIIKLLGIAILTTFLNWFLYRVNFIKAITTTAISYIFYIIGDVIAGALLSFFDYSIFSIQNTHFIWIVSNSIGVLSSTLLVNIRAIRKTLSLDAGIQKNNTLILGYVFFILTLINLNVIYYNILPDELIKIFTIINLSSFIIYLIITLYIVYINNKYLKEQIKYKQKENEYQQLKLYTNLIEQLLEDFKRYRHDNTNIMSSLMNYIDNNDIENLKKYYYSEVVTDYNQLNIRMKETLSLKKLKNTALKGLLTNKFYEALKAGVNFELDVLDDIDEINMKTIDLCKSVGILIDNAIEETLKTESKSLSFSMLKDNSEINIVISNTYLEQPDINKIYQNGYSTKGEDRGLGLKILKDTVKQYDNVLLNTMLEKDLFIQELVIN